MDLGSVIGLLAAFGVLLFAILEDAGLSSILNLPAFLIIVGGASTVTLVCTPTSTFKQIFSILRKCFFFREEPIAKVITQMVQFAEVARRDGILSLESMTKEIEDPFLVRGIQMAVDGTDPELIQQIMTAEVENMMERHHHAKTIFENIGRFAPAFGIIGTVIGLVGIFSKMDDPSKVGAGMAVALLATLYGAITANVIALPLADKLTKRSAEEVLMKSIIIKGVMSIQSGDNPRIVEQKLLTFLPPAARKRTASADGESKSAA